MLPCSSSTSPILIKEYYIKLLYLEKCFQESDMGLHLKVSWILRKHKVKNNVPKPEEISNGFWVTWH